MEERLERAFTSQGNVKRWVPILNDINNAINNSVHSSINMKPADVNRGNARMLFEYLESLRSKENRQRKTKFNEGDIVRIPRKNIKRFEKGAVAKWSRELYQIHQIHWGSRVPTFTIHNSNGIKADRRYYENELNLVIPFYEFNQKK